MSLSPLGFAAMAARLAELEQADADLAKAQLRVDKARAEVTHVQELSSAATAATAVADSESDVGSDP